MRQPYEKENIKDAFLSTAHFSLISIGERASLFLLENVMYSEEEEEEEEEVVVVVVVLVAVLMVVVVLLVEV
ncbi:hypothetical protein MKX75_27030 [Paenibacillus sp. FSL R5-0341]|uniref:hypothetical protein n=1 Tax=Paenibacillus sp. FSL R5-0341 TaxID=2921636 RepID=UPI0030CC59A9